ncbi:MAG: HAD-IB family phosphatase [Deltaproteobacteria bacterium]|nr:HAD-IB family phosphatase [Deltaproteobacteria bacterium]
MIRPTTRADQRLAVVVDFDGTASTRDVGYSLLERFARDGSWKVIDNDYETGRIGSRDAYRLVARLLDGGVEQWTEFALSAAALDPGLSALAGLARARGWRAEILSDGLGFYIRAFLRREGIDLPVRANELLAASPPTGTRIVTPFLNPRCGRCGTCKAERVETLVRAGWSVVYVGDGYSDLCAAPRAGRVFAKGILAQHCRARHIPFETFENLADVAVALAPD